MSYVLVVNSGSSSFKYQLINMATEARVASGLVERIGEPMGLAVHSNVDGTSDIERPIADHTEGFAAMMEAFAKSGHDLGETPPSAVGHRVVHGGKRFFAPTIVDDDVAWNINDLSELAPLHNPANYQGIVAARIAFPDVPHVVVFDTAFHQTMPAEAYTYAIDRELAERYRVRKYGFHGTSHKFVSEAAAAFVERPLSELKQIVLHLGNGASMCAIDGGVSQDTSMGMTPLQGLVMGTRSGDVDPSALFHLSRKAGFEADDLDELLNRRSGLLGLAGTGDMRDVSRLAEEGDAHAQLALDVYHRRIRHYLGAYLVHLGGADVLAFTAGIGENSPETRAEVLRGLEWLGIRIDPERNALPNRGPRRISSDDSAIDVLVIPTDEELEIARQTIETIEGAE
ncbi:acetate/propionate family kinase [Lysinibacter cavernae]|uniref:Acetate kinase n=1 Tax=Lysinibacter cavernae TaxID=1640652 RepID=A0A7X5R4J4_9MICO|nr:acetate kinase [Lysinibacter cavernae]NIH55247.1 acetate kinase [Lysinibacter cavernae]